LQPLLPGLMQGFPPIDHGFYDTIVSFLLGCNGLVKMCYLEIG
jgi:hypothetical protein